MSCYICNKEHIRELAAYYVNHCARDYYEHGSTTKRAQEVFDTLAKANADSFNYRYGDSVEPEQLTMTAGMMTYPRVTDPGHIAKMCDGYVYQACETGDTFYQGPAYRFIERIRGKLLEGLDGYEDGPWSYTETSEHPMHEEGSVICLSDL